MQRVSKRTGAVAAILVIIAIATIGLQFRGVAIGHWVARGVIAALLGIVIWEYVRACRAGRRFVPPRPRQLVVPGLFVVAGAVVAFLVANLIWGVALIVLGAIILSVSTAETGEATSRAQHAARQLGG